MDNIFDLGFFLRTVSPTKRKDYSRDNLLDDVVSMLVYERSIVDRNGNHYLFSREMTTKLVTNKANMPQAIQNALRNGCLNNSKYAASAYSFFEKYIGQVNMYSVCKTLCEQYESDSFYENSQKTEVLRLFHSKNYDELLWNMFCIVSLAPNRRGKTCTSKRIRQPNRRKDDFFYLSEEEKKKRAEYFVGYLRNVNNRLHTEELKALLEILAYTNLEIAPSIKQEIICHFLESWTPEDNISDVDSLLLHFESAKLTYADRQKRFEAWESVIKDAFPIVEMSKIERLLKNAKTDSDYSEINCAFDSSVNKYDVFCRSKVFVSLLARDGFHLPDFSQHINESLWHYCHSIAAFLAKQNIQTHLLNT